MAAKNLEQRILDLVRSASERGIGMRDVLERFGSEAGRATLFRAVGRLLRDGRILKIGAARAARYYPDDASAYLSLPANQRQAVGYDFGRLESYRPNESRLMPPEVSERLRHAAAVADPARFADYARAIRERLMVDLSWASSCLEGNTYSYLDTEALVLYGEAAEGHSWEETQMVLNHKSAIRYMLDHIGDIEVTPREIKALHALLAQGLLDPMACGSIRRRPVVIGDSAYRPLDVPFQLEEQLNLLVDKARRIEDPVEQSLFLLAFLSYLQPFEDVNKRTARLAANIPLLKKGMGPLSFLEMSRREYLSATLLFYELGRADALARVYAAGYLGSLSRYSVDASRLLDSEEQRFALRHRRELSAAVRLVVTGGVAIDTAVVKAGFPQEETERARALVSKHLRALTEDNAVVYGLTPAAVAAWRPPVGPPPVPGPRGGDGRMRI